MCYSKSVKRSSDEITTETGEAINFQGLLLLSYSIAVRKKLLDV